jgi:hypothetical protein
MLTDNKLLIDKNCPMCNIYGKCFEKTGLIDNKTVAYFQDISEPIYTAINQKKAKSEVAFYNEKTGTSLYGVAAFLHILGHKNKIVNAFLHSKPVYFLAQKTYRFISYNRQVMAGAHINPEERDCTPSMHLGYRLAYIILAALFTGLLVNHFSYLLDQQFGITHNSWREYLICFGQIGWQFLAISYITKEKRLDYLGNMSTVSVIGGLLLVPLFIFDAFGSLNQMQLLLYFGLVVSSMFLMHIKRAKNIGLPLTISISWIVYRLSVLIIILSLSFLS